jgi:hypothetical protein
MDELQLGPNGGLVYCMEYLLQNMDWLQENLDEYDDDEYLILDCPGQIELYTHIPVMNRIIDQLRLWGYNDKLVSVFIVDATFVTDPAKFISGSLLALSAMISMQLPHVNVLSKCDLVEEGSMERVLEMESAMQLWDVLGDHGRHHNRGGGGDDADGASMLSFLREESPFQQHFSTSNHGRTTTAAAVVATTSTTSSTESETLQQNARTREKKWNRLTEAICSLLDDYSMVGFIPLNINDEDSIAHVLATVDHAIQYGEDLEVRGADYDDDVGGDYEDGDD